MDRATARALAASTLLATNDFVSVLDHEPASLDTSPVATVHSKSLGLSEISHGEIVLVGMIWVTLYVARDGLAGDVVETQIDTLSRSTLLALRPVFANGSVDATVAASESGYVMLDGKAYRLERFAIRVEEELEEPF